MNPVNVSTSASMPGWSKAGFPATIMDEKQSLKFVRHLVAVGFSQVLYLRSELPDDCFQGRSIGDIELKLLKVKSKSDAANTLTKALKSAMEALDLGYLRTLILVFMENKNKPEEVFETYTFTFDKPPNDVESISSSPGFSLVQKAKKGNKEKSKELDTVDTVTKIIASGDMIEDKSIDQGATNGYVDEGRIFRATKRLLRKLIAAMQGLNELPNQMYCTIKVGYYDDITPQDYQPGAFRSTDEKMYFPEEEAQTLNLGGVKTMFHHTNLALASKAYVDPDKSADQSMLQAEQSTNAQDVTKPVKDGKSGNTKADNTNHNASLISLNPGLDMSTLEPNNESGSILAHGSFVENCNNAIDNEAESTALNRMKAMKISNNLDAVKDTACSESKDLNNVAPNSKVERKNAPKKDNLQDQRRNKRAKTTQNTSEENEHLLTKERKFSRLNSEIMLGSLQPTAGGDNQLMQPLNKGSIQTLEETDAKNNNVDVDLHNTSRSSRLSVRSQLSVRSIRRAVSVRDTFRDDIYYADFHPKASKANVFIRI